MDGKFIAITRAKLVSLLAGIHIADIHPFAGELDALYPLYHPAFPISFQLVIDTLCKKFPLYVLRLTISLLNFINLNNDKMNKTDYKVQYHRTWNRSISYKVVKDSITLVSFNNDQLSYNLLYIYNQYTNGFYRISPEHGTMTVTYDSNEQMITFNGPTGGNFICVDFVINTL